MTDEELIGSADSLRSYRRRRQRSTRWWRSYEPVRLTRAIDRWMGELARGGRTESTRIGYRRHLNKLIDQLERTKPDPDVREVTVNDCRTFLDNWINQSASTQCTVHSAVKGLFDWLYLEGEVDASPMVRVKRPRRPVPEDVAVKTITR